MTALLNYAADLKLAKKLWGKTINHVAIRALKQTMENHSLSLVAGDLIFLEGRWYVTSGGLLRLARRNRCAGIHVEPVPEFSNATASRWAFKATVYKSRSCKGFVGYGDADPSNVSPLFHGAELRIAETRATNRALRKAYSISICSTEELASSAGSPGPGRESK